MSNGIKLDDYVDVATRIREFRERYPDGSLQPADPARPYRIETIGDQTFIVVVAAAYRSPDDTRPGIGMAYEPWPGRTPYTRGSELQNAETSAWGRAIVAALAADTRAGIATADEVRARVAEREQAPPEPSAATMRDRPVTKAQLAKLAVLLRQYGIQDRDAGLAYVADTIGREVSSSKDLTCAEASEVIDRLARELAPEQNGSDAWQDA